MNSRSLFKPGIRARLTIIILLISLIPLAFLGYQSYFNQKKFITEEVTASHLELSNTLAHGIYENLEFTRRLLNTIGELEAVKSLNPAVSEDFFNALMRHFAFFKLMYLIDSERNIIATTDAATRLPADWLYSKAIRRSYQGSLSEVVTSADGMPFMTLESVIKSPERLGITGVLISEVNLSSIRDLLRNALKNSKSQGLVLDEAGSVIARSSDEARTLNIPMSETIDSDLTRLRDIDGEPYLITAVSLKKFDFYQAPNWTIVLQIPERIAFDAAYKFRARIIRILSLTAIISIFLAVLLARGFTAPLSNLINGARHISGGDFEHRIQPMSSDEIGELTATFDEMRVNLRTTKADLDYRILQLSTLYEVGKAISSELDFRKLQNMILEIVVKVVKAEKGSLMLIDDAEKNLTIGVAVGLSEEITRDTRLEIGESVAGWVVKNRQPLFAGNVETDATFQSIKKKNIRTGTMMCAPLTAKDKILGTLNISRSEPDSFSEKDFELFIAALSAITGRVVAIGLYICGDGVGEQDVAAILDCDGDRESEGLEEFWIEISDALYAGVSIAGWNIQGFDLPFLVRRSWMLDVAVPGGLRKGRYWSEQLIDLMQVWGFHGREYTKLDVAAKALGLKGKVTEAAGTEVCGADFHRLWRENRKAAEEYLNQDVRLCVQIANCMGII